MATYKTMQKTNNQQQQQQQQHKDFPWNLMQIKSLLFFLEIKLHKQQACIVGLHIIHDIKIQLYLKLTHMYQNNVAK